MDILHTSFIYSCKLSPLASSGGSVCQRWLRDTGLCFTPSEFSRSAVKSSMILTWSSLVIRSLYSVGYMIAGGS